MKRITSAILAILLVAVAMLGVACEITEHACESVCQTCRGCLDANCTESACATKCPGHPEETEKVQVKFVTLM